MQNASMLDKFERKENIYIYIYIYIYSPPPLNINGCPDPNCFTWTGR